MSDIVTELRQLSIAWDKPLDKLTPRDADLLRRSTDILGGAADRIEQLNLDIQARDKRIAELKERNSE